MISKKWMLLTTALATLIGCGGADGGAGGASAAQIGQGLSPGDHEIEVVGYVRSIGPYSGSREAAVFAPNTYGATRERRDGTGGRQEVVATNDDGPYVIRMRADLQRNEQEPDRETASVAIHLPPEARAGQTYVLETPRRARHGEAFLAINGYGQVLPFGGSGTVTVAELGEHVSLQFEFRGGSAEHEDERHVIGRAYKIPLSRQGEARYTLSMDGQSEPYAQRTIFRNARSIMVGSAMQINFDGEIAQPGSYRLANRQAEGVIGLQLFDHRDVDISGHIELERQDDVWAASFEFEGTGEGETTISGRGGFDHVAAWRR